MDGGDFAPVIVLPYGKRGHIGAERAFNGSVNLILTGEASENLKFALSVAMFLLVRTKHVASDVGINCRVLKSAKRTMVNGRMKILGCFAIIEK